MLNYPFVCFVFIYPELAMAAWCYEFIFLLDKYNFVHEKNTWSWSLHCYVDRDSHNLLQVLRCFLSFYCRIWHGILRPPTKSGDKEFTKYNCHFFIYDD